MENEKCPLCGSEISDFEDSGFWECEECPFMCALADLPHVAAAMELARAESKLMQSVEDCAGYEQAIIDRAHARKRVIEVFGGE